MIEAVRATGGRGRLHYSHARAHTEPLLALPDIAAWAWARSGEWRRRLDPLMRARQAHTV
jgi:hypothetical protein